MADAVPRRLAPGGRNKQASQRRTTCAIVNKCCTGEFPRLHVHVHMSYVSHGGSWARVQMCWLVGCCHEEDHSPSKRRGPKAFITIIAVVAIPF